MYRLIKAGFNYKKEDGTDVNGDIYFGEKKGIMYSPEMIIVTHGTISLNHRNNDGESAEYVRSIKEEIIVKYCHTNSGVSAEVAKPFIMKTKGLVGMMSIISGANQNNSGDIRLKSSILSKYKAARMFQNLKPLKSKEKIGEVISIEIFTKENGKYIAGLEANYNKNIETASKE